MKKWVKITLSAVLIICLLCGGAVGVDAIRTNKQTKALLQEAQAQNAGPFSAGDTNGSLYHRIPALYTLKDGTLLAAADARFTGTTDSPNNLDTIVSTSADEGKTWGEPIFANHFTDYADTRVPALRTAKKSLAQRKSASFIDPALVQDVSTSRIFMLTDMFPSGGGYPTSEAGTGYTNINGKSYLKLRKKGSKTFNYTVRENNVIFDENGKPTPYSLNSKMEVLKDGKALTVRQRNVFYLFNRLLAKPGSEKVPMNIMYRGSLFQPLTTSYLCLTYSDDGGKTWSDPQILNSMVKSEEMTFLGVGPGRGHQIKEGAHQGRLLFPVYAPQPESGKQECYVIYSDDHGATWKRSEAPSFDEAVVKNMSESALVELPGGVLQMFTRNTADRVASSISTDGGVTWSEGKLVDALPTGGSSCQISAVNYSGLVDGKPAVLLSTPSGNNRTHGVIHVGLVNEKAGDLPEIEWKYTYEVTGKDEAFLYSCLTVLPGGEVGLLYEKEGMKQPFNMITYQTYTMEQLTGGKAQ